MVVLVIVLLLPLGAYFLLKSGKHVYKTLEIVGERKPVVNDAGKTDTLYHTIYNAYPDFRFVTDDLFRQLIHHPFQRPERQISRIFAPARPVRRTARRATPPAPAKRPAYHRRRARRR